jgi:hypothetical protein
VDSSGGLSVISRKNYNFIKLISSKRKVVGGRRKKEREKEKKKKKKGSVGRADSQ